MRIKIIFIAIFMLLLIPLWMGIFWIFSSTQRMEVMILDKTVLNKTAMEHRSFNWILDNLKIVKEDDELYSVEEDYYGFFPLKNEEYYVKSLEQYHNQNIDSVASLYDMVYFTDTYGIYYNEWYLNRLLTERSPLVYGGTNLVDYMFLEKFKEQNKLILMEFNTIAQPTPTYIRKKIENSFDLTWSGWTGRYFNDLDTLRNRELPRWVIKLYKQQHDGNWPFSKSGIIFVNENETIEILENETHLESEVPIIVSTEEGQEKFGIIDEIEYPYWFDILSYTGKNNVYASYNIVSNAAGDSILKRNGIPKNFPSVLEYMGDYKFYYFAGDYADNTTYNLLARMKGIEYFRHILYPGDISSRERFFWEFYTPLMKTILENYLSDAGEKKLLTRLN